LIKMGFGFISFVSVNEVMYIWFKWGMPLYLKHVKESEKKS